MGNWVLVLFSLFSLSASAYTTRPAGRVETLMHVFDIDITKCEKNYRAVNPNGKYFRKGYGICTIYECEKVEPHISFERVVKTEIFKEAGDLEYRVHIAAGDDNNYKASCSYTITFLPPEGLNANWADARDYVEKSIAKIPNGKLEVPVLRIVQ